MDVSGSIPTLFGDKRSSQILLGPLTMLLASNSQVFLGLLVNRHSCCDESERASKMVEVMVSQRDPRFNEYYVVGKSCPAWLMIFENGVPLHLQHYSILLHHHQIY